MNRRGFLTGLVSAIAAPAVVTTPGLLMPLRGIVPWWIGPDRMISVVPASMITALQEAQILINERASGIIQQVHYIPDDPALLLPPKSA